MYDNIVFYTEDVCQGEIIFLTSYLMEVSRYCDFSGWMSAIEMPFPESEDDNEKEKSSSDLMTPVLRAHQ